MCNAFAEFLFSIFLSFVSLPPFKKIGQAIINGSYSFLIFLPFISLPFHVAVMSLLNMNPNIRNSLGLDICWCCFPWFSVSDMFPCVFVTSCYFVEFHMRESLGSSLGTSKHSWVLPVVISILEEHVFLLFWLFYQGRDKRTMFRFSLPPFRSHETESTYNKVP